MMIQHLPHYSARRTFVVSLLLVVVLAGNDLVAMADESTEFCYAVDSQLDSSSCTSPTMTSGHMTQDELYAKGMDFASKFYWKLVQPANGTNTPSNELAKSNVIASPWSLNTLLGMVLYGARNQTRLELSSLLVGRDIGDGHLDDLAAAYKNQLDDILAENSKILSVADLAYIQNRYSVKGTYKSALEKAFHAAVSSVEFGSADSLTKINGDVSRATKGKIEKLFNDPFDPLTRLVLVNAVHLKGLWSVPFLANNTKSELFKPENGSPAEPVQMMHQSSRHRIGYSAVLECQALLLPYNDSQAAMLVLLPSEGTTLASLEREIFNGAGGVKNLQELMESMEPSKVSVSLPKFKIESTHDKLTNQIKSLGAREMFVAGQADFGGIVDGDAHDLSVSSIIQKAVIEVNEEGTEAAAASGATMVARSWHPPQEFRADRPFLFMILARHEKRPPVPLFIGSFRKP